MDKSSDPQSLRRYIAPWGESYKQYINYAAHLCCPKCQKLEKVRGNKRWFEAVIGFSETKPRQSSEGIGILIFECPHCYTKFWTHLTPAGIWDCMCFCAQWPKKMKHPDLRE